MAYENELDTEDIPEGYENDTHDEDEDELTESLDTTQAEFEIYSLISDISDLYGALYETVSDKIPLEEPENQELMNIWMDFDGNLSISSLLVMEMTDAIRTMLGNDSQKIQELLAQIIMNVNARLDEIDPEEPEAPQEMYETDPSEIVYN